MARESDARSELAASTPSEDDPVFENLPVPALVVDQNRKLCALNREARRLFPGHPTPPITCRTLVQCTFDDKHCPLLRALAQQPLTSRMEFLGHIRKGRRFLVERVSLFRDPYTHEQKAILTYGDATSQQHQLRLLRRDAQEDLLTGVLSRNHFENLFQRHARSLERRSVPAAFLMIDVDRLKVLNDTRGHRAGDELLARLGRLLRSAVRKSDMVGRLGGDEFGIYCPNTGLSKARQLAERLQRSIDEDNRRFPTLFPLQIGIGIAVTHKGNYRMLRELADLRLYRYKRSRPPA